MEDNELDLSQLFENQSNGDFGGNDDIFLDKTESGKIESGSGKKSSKKTNEESNELDLAKLGLTKEDDEDDTLLNMDDSKVDETEDKTKDKSTTKEDKKDNTKSTDTKGKQISGLDIKEVFKDLYDSEILTVDIPEDMEATDESVRDIFIKQLSKDKEELTLYLDDKHGGIFSFLEKGGKIEDFIKVHTEHTYDTETLENVLSDDSKMEKAFKEYYTRKGLSENLINKNFKRTKDLDELTDEIKELFPSLQESDKQIKLKIVEDQKKAAAEQSERNNQFKSDIDKYIDGMNEVVPSKNLSVKDKTAIKVLAKSDDVFKELNKDPIKARTLLAALKYYGVLDGKWDNIISDIKTNVTKDTLNKYFMGSKTKGGEGMNTGSNVDSNKPSPVAAFSKMKL